MFKFFKNFFSREKEEADTIARFLEKKSKEIETGAWLGHGIVSSDGLTIYAKFKNNYYKLDRLLPYGVKIYDTVEKFHEKSKASFKDILFKKPEVVVYKTESFEEIFIVKKLAGGIPIYLVWIASPTSVFSGFSTDKMMIKLSVWLQDVAEGLGKILERKGRKSNEA